MDGAFLIRPSGAEKRSYAISFRWGRRAEKQQGRGEGEGECMEGGEVKENDGRREGGAEGGGGREGGGGEDSNRRER